ncbi:2-dehydropantoate 2-reductase [Nocardia puris]|uniref:2-dehydropantoate 2-reductase n=1 Tax=Nocardia puris TaxID=208602 RepID=UPI002E1B2F7C
MVHIVVIGAGGVGGYFAALLSEHGHEVTVVARGETLEAIGRSGIRIEEAGHARVVRPARVVNSHDETPTADIVLVCVKSWQVTAAAKAIRPVVSAHTMVIPVQNGVDAAARLTHVLGADRVVAGVCTVFARRTTPTTIERLGDPPSLRIGSLPGAASQMSRLETTASMLADAGIASTVSVDIWRDLWRKLIFISSFGGVCALANATAGVIRDQPRTRALFHAAVHEAAAVARAASTKITPADVDDAVSRLDYSDPRSTASMMRDLAAGKPSELYEQTGAIVHYGEWLNVPTPTHSVVYGALLPRELRARGDQHEPD